VIIIEVEVVEVVVSEVDLEVEIEEDVVDIIMIEGVHQIIFRMRHKKN